MLFDVDLARHRHASQWYAALWGWSFFPGSPVVMIPHWLQRASVV